MKGTPWSEETRQQIERHYIQAEPDSGKRITLQDLSALYGIPVSTLNVWSKHRNWSEKRMVAERAAAADEVQGDVWILQPVVEAEVARQLHGEEAVEAINAVAEQIVTRQVGQRIKPALDYVHQHMDDLDSLRAVGLHLVSMAASVLPRTAEDMADANWTPGEVLRAMQLGRDTIIGVIQTERKTLGLPDTVVEQTVHLGEQADVEQILESKTVHELAMALKDMGLATEDDMAIVDAEFEVEVEVDSEPEQTDDFDFVSKTEDNNGND